MSQIITGVQHRILKHHRGHHRLHRQAVLRQRQPGSLHCTADQNIGFGSVVGRQDGTQNG
jgi:hypothetical protein